jgi:uncharacterized protein (TIGR02118 family)
VVTVVTFVARRPGMAVAAFLAHWRTRHPDVVRRLPGIRRYVQSHVVPAMYAKGEPAWDGIAEIWADDTDALRAMAASPAHAEVQADEARFLDRARTGFIVTEERVVADGAVGEAAVKAVELLTRRPGLGVEAFQAHWHGPHAALAARVPGLRRYVASATRAAAYRSGRAPAYDGAALLWFDSMDALKAAGASAEYRALVADRDAFLAPGAPPFLLTREHVIVG